MGRTVIRPVSGGGGFPSVRFRNGEAVFVEAAMAHGPAGPGL
jgi:hypothetical protein